jgi:Skp family chaperone for outer membrane proteins
MAKLLEEMDRRVETSLHFPDKITNHVQEYFKVNRCFQGVNRIPRDYTIFTDLEALKKAVNQEKKNHQESWKDLKDISQRLEKLEYLLESLDETSKMEIS